MSVKYEWRKKSLYIPKEQPEFINVPEFQYITLYGEGSPDESLFSDIVGTLYSVAYGIKMLAKIVQKNHQAILIIQSTRLKVYGILMTKQKKYLQARLKKKISFMN